jgi:nucleotide-binding universal stress UspA family protein
MLGTLKLDRILLASHGTTGARAAEEMTLELCRNPGAVVFHLTVVPDLWRGMMGDDWLNNVSTRDVYCKHIESQLGTEIDRHRKELEPRVLAHGARYRAKVTIGKPAECLLDFAAEVRPDLVIIGSPRPPGTPGLRSRMQVEKLVKTLAAPLLISPYPR